MARIIDSIRALAYRSASLSLLGINVSVFLTLHIIAALTPLSGTEVTDILGLPASAHTLLHRPWSILTYMFVQIDFMHLLVNMVLLLCFGRMLESVKPMSTAIRIYLYGGLMGAFVFLAGSASGLLSGGTVLIGASGAVMAIVAATAVILPDMRVTLFPFRTPVRMKWIAIAVIGFQVLSLLTAGNGGGHAAHAGGIISGIAYGLYSRYGRQRM
ncbi:MAG: rhomboid family intramembrane serine protease, partial [Muribaculaceae bacterium]|nr:rhomboid family intramembrane serine protease [Muribaculaceae bacterium]